MQNNCFRVSNLVITMACGCRAFAPLLLPSSSVMNRNFVSINRPARLSCPSLPPPSLRHASPSIYIQAAVDGKDTIADIKSEKDSTKQVVDHHAAVNDAYGMIYHGSVPSHSKTAAVNLTGVSTDESTKGVVQNSVDDTAFASDGAAFKVVRDLNRFSLLSKNSSRRSRMEKIARESFCAP